MTIIYIFLTTIAILLIVNIILTLKAGKKEESNELNEIKSAIETLIFNLKDIEKNLKNEFVTTFYIGTNCPQLILQKNY
jgi:hypothetical protein